MPGRVLISMQNSVVRTVVWISRLLPLSVPRWQISVPLPTPQRRPILCEPKQCRQQLGGRTTFDCVSGLVILNQALRF